jgi:glutamate dehydrogenase (NAD(P)+)
VFYCARQVLNDVRVAKNLGVEPGVKGKKFIVQGFGNVGYWASKFFVSEGAILVGVAEFDGSIYNENGIDPDTLLDFKKNNSGIRSYPGCQSFEDEAAIYEKA